MKTNFSLLIIMLIIVSCNNDRKYSKQQKTIITGQVSNFSKCSEHSVIEFIYNDLLADQVTIAEYIDHKGKFRFELDIKFPSEFYLKYSALQTYYISPGDSIHFKIDGNCWQNISKTNAEENQYYNVSGTSQKMNNDVANFTAFFFDSINNWEKEKKFIKTLTPIEYKKYIHKRTEERLSFISNYNKNNNTGQQFQEWILMKTKFEKWDDLMRYRWLHPHYNNKDTDKFIASIPKEYYDFMNKWDKENIEYLKSNSYKNFLNEYLMYVNQLIHSDTLKEIYTKQKNAPNKQAIFFQRYYNQIEKGLIKDILVSKYYYQMLNKKYFEQINDVFKKEQIDDIHLKNRIHEKFNYEKDLFENPQFDEGSILNEPNDKNDFLQNLMKKHSGKVMYIDIWAPWCSPCMDEIPYTKVIKKEFENKDVVFVYLANRCEKNAWESTIAEKKIEGEHYHLSDKQFSNLTKTLDIKGIPHFTIIDKNGNIAIKNALRPSSGKDLIEMINTYLK